MTHFFQRTAILLVATSALCASPALARTHHKRGEVLAELPSQWRGFLLDQRHLPAHDQPCFMRHAHFYLTAVDQMDVDGIGKALNEAEPLNPDL